MNTTFTTTYNGSEFELIWNAPKVIDVYINGAPRFCGIDTWDCVRKAKAIIDQARK
jgi:hypothetical protein